MCGAVHTNYLNFKGILVVFIDLIAKQFVVSDIPYMKRSVCRVEGKGRWCWRGKACARGLRMSEHEKNIGASDGDGCVPSAQHSMAFIGVGSPALTSPCGGVCPPDLVIGLWLLPVLPSHFPFHIDTDPDADVNIDKNACSFFPSHGATTNFCSTRAMLPSFAQHTQRWVLPHATLLKEHTSNLA